MVRLFGETTKGTKGTKSRDALPHSCDSWFSWFPNQELMNVDPRVFCVESVKKCPWEENPCPSVFLRGWSLVFPERREAFGRRGRRGRETRAERVMRRVRRASASKRVPWRLRESQRAD